MFFKKKKELSVKEDLVERMERERAEQERYVEYFRKEVKEQNKVINYLKELGCFKSDFIEVMPFAEYFYNNTEMDTPECKWSRYKLGDWEYRSHESKEIDNSRLDTLLILMGNKLPVIYKFKRDWSTYKDVYVHTPTDIAVRILYTPKSLKNKESSKKFEVVEVTDNLIKWIQKEFKERHSENAVIGISGGKDSTICAMLSVLALGKEHVYGYMLPNGEQKDILDSHKVCDTLGITNSVINIGPAYEALTKSLNAETNYVYKTNTPARIRMTTLYGMSAIIGKSLVINTCNLCEDYVGYSTKFGDSAGDISYLANLTTEEVLAIGVECAKRLSIQEEMRNLIFKTPSDGMCGKSDEDNLGYSYVLLSDYIRGYAEPKKEIKEKIDKQHLANLHKLEKLPSFPYKGE